MRRKKRLVRFGSYLLKSACGLVECGLQICIVFGGSMGDLRDGGTWNFEVGVQHKCAQVLRQHACDLGYTSQTECALMYESD